MKKMEKSFYFENIIAWQKAHAFTISVYQITKLFPQDELFALTSQFRRAAVSIEANIAEGCKKLSKADKLRFLNISEGSLEECRDYIVLSRDLDYISTDVFEELKELSNQASWFLNAYITGIKNNSGIKD
jgi:four helix bundle protein